MPQLVSQQPPPADYYAGNLRHLLTEVRSRCLPLLDATDRAFIAVFLGASVSAQRLFARLLSRQGPWIRVDSLDYQEVTDGPRALEELCAAGLVALDPVAPADALLNLFTRRELAELFPLIVARTKVEWIRRCVAHYPDDAIRRRLAECSNWVLVSAYGAFNVCRLLYFGDDRQDLSTFVVQDLGLLRYESYELGPRTRPFDTRAQVEGYLHLRGMAMLSRTLDDMPALASVLLAKLWHEPATRTEQRLRNRLLLKLARWHERRGELDEALQCYARTSAHPGRERRVRILMRLGDHQGARCLVAQMALSPWNAEEEDFARHFGRRGRRGGPRTTQCCLSGTAPGSIENHARRLLSANVGGGWHLENRFPLGLAGLLYWDEIYAPVKGAFTNRFQLAPRDLFWPDFAAARRPMLEARTAMLSHPGAVAARLKQVWAEKSGTANLLVHWQLLSARLVDLLVSQLPEQDMLRLAERTIGNLHRLKNGFPDLLMIYGPGAYEFVEVKGPGDQLQPAQRIWLRELDELGLPARVLKFQP